MTDPVALTADLVRCPSVTPAEAGAIALLERLLGEAGFACTRISRGGVENLYARYGHGGRVFGFNGHTDVVPVGDPADWSADPFGAAQQDGMLIGRGSVDMKSGVAAFATAAIDVAAGLDPAAGSIVLMITGDEEGDAEDGTVAILDWMAAQGERVDFCLVGEPTSLQKLGDQVKIGRRGSMTGLLTVMGTQGHTAYPHRAENPLPALARICARLAATPLDQGSAHFEPSTLQLTTIDVGNPASNVIPRQGRARFNIRFNDLHVPEDIEAWTDAIVAAELTGSGLEAEIAWAVSGVAFLTEPQGPVENVIAAVEAATGQRPALSTGGGTSDARFVKDHCPVVEFGLVGRGMHAVDEQVPIGDIAALSEIYADILRRFHGLLPAP
ncbi:MAG: succinyl-diaminopimelate desuccinylase [Pseudomonadota bacterium]